MAASSDYDGGSTAWVIRSGHGTSRETAWPMQAVRQYYCVTQCRRRPSSWPLTPAVRCSLDNLIGPGDSTKLPRGRRTERMVLPMQEQRTLSPAGGRQNVRLGRPRVLIGPNAQRLWSVLEIEREIGDPIVAADSLQRCKPQVLFIGSKTSCGPRGRPSWRTNSRSKVGGSGFRTSSLLVFPGRPREDAVIR